MKPALHKGQLARWKDDRGFGFIQPDDGSQEVFLHITGFKDVNRLPQVGDFICYQLIASKDGKIRACNASIEGIISKSSSSTAPKKSISRSVNKSLSLVLQTLLLSLLPGLGSIHLEMSDRKLFVQNDDSQSQVLASHCTNSWTTLMRHTQPSLFGITSLKLP